MDENPYGAPQGGLQSSFTLTCCRCWKRFEIYGEQAERTSAFYASQPNHTPDKEVGICDECWPKCQKPEQQSPMKETRLDDNGLMDENPYRADKDGAPSPSRRAYTVRWLQIWLLNNVVVWATAILWTAKKGPDDLHAYIMAGIGTAIVTIAALWNILRW
jgi:hypothetical protein